MQGLNIFTKTANWSYSQKDKLAEAKFQELISEDRSNLPSNFFSENTLGYADEARKTKLYKWLKTIPKGVIHHLHFDCAQDLQFYRNYIMDSHVIYLNQQMNKFEVGSKKQAIQKNWISMQQIKKKYKSQEQMCKFLLNKSTMNTQQMAKYTNSQHSWPVFQERIANFQKILHILPILKNYFRHICLKHIKNGYQRIQLRFLIMKLREYDEDGNLTIQHEDKKFAEVCQEVIEEINKQHPHFSVGFIAFGLLQLSAQENFKLLSRSCSINWKNLVAIDFVQEQDPHGSLQPYDKVANKILQTFPDRNLKKAYHAGDTKKFKNNNVQFAIKAGSVRIGHGTNILQKGYLFEVLNKNVCFQVNPVSDLFMGNSPDIRKCHGTTLLNLGVPISISSDDPGKFNNQDTTMDYWISLMSFDWSMKHLKLVAYHSINHAICNEEHKSQMIKNFNKNWNAFVDNFLSQ